MITRRSPLPAQVEARAVADRVLELSGADQTEVVLLGSDSRLTRFAANQIHQNVATRDLEIRVRAVLGQRVGVASTNDHSEASLRRVVERAATVARLQPENPDFKGLPLAHPTPDMPGAFIERTAGFTPAQRAEVVAGICREAAAAGLTASGAFETGAHSITVANSLGVFGHHVGTKAMLSTVVMGDDSSGYAARMALDAGAIDGPETGREAIDKAVRGREPVDVDPGKWTVLLEEYAVADMLAYLAFVGFGAMAFQQGASFMAGRVGDRVCADTVSVWDDALDPAGLMSPFDYEGVPRRRVDLIERGIARGPVYDTFTACRANRESTGHAHPAPTPYGPFPTSLFMGAGTQSKADLLRGMRKGIWVTRFHYVNVMDPKATVITGMTRDGAFLVEDGKIVRPIRNLRFTEEIVGALSRVSGVAQDTLLIPTWFGSARCPAIRIEDFTFSGKTAADAQ